MVYYDAATDETVLTGDLHPSASNPYYLVVFNDKLYFSTLTEDYGRELWEYNDTTLAIVADIRPGIPDADPAYLTLFNEKLYFSANDGIRGAEIWSLAECLNVFVDTEPQIDDIPGNIDLTIQGGLPPYTISWNTGSVTEDIENLEQGTYTATVTDASGCLSVITAEVGFINHTEEIIPESRVMLYPNPNTGSFTLKIPGLKMEAVEIFDMNGRLIYQKLANENPEETDIHLRYAPSGIYWVRLRTTEGVARKRFVKE